VTVHPVAAGEISHFDIEADVLIAGYGVAGASATVEAARPGAEVVVLERTGGWGGAAALAGGFIYLGGGTPIQKEGWPRRRPLRFYGGNRPGVCGRVAELESELGPPNGSLQTTLAAYNDGAARGDDPLLRKKPQWLRPIGTPVRAIDPRGATGGFPLGGLDTTLAAKVLHVGGDPTPGLLAAGRATASIAAWGYASGASLGDGSFYGRRAGRLAARA
jgi:predicted oxidoreductase